MVPEQAAIAHLVELGDACPIRAGGYMLGNDIHRDLGKVEVGAETDRGRNARLGQNVRDEHGGELVCRHAGCAQVARHVDEDLVNGVDVNVLGGDMAQVYLVNLRAALKVEGHAWRGDDIVEGELGMLG